MKTGSTSSNLNKSLKVVTMEKKEEKKNSLIVKKKWFREL